MNFEDVFGEQGLLSKKVKNFSFRPVQLAMAERIGDAIADSETIVVEGGTGIGKTFAYLIPALLSGKRVLISTGTKHLQDQLFKRDLPVVAKALGLPKKLSLLKGRSNYLCIQRLENVLSQRGLQFSADDKELAAVERWSLETRDGDCAELVSVSEQAPIWPQVTSTVDNCLGSNCQHYQDCYVVKARRRAIASDVVVVNHHLFFADILLKKGGFGELLPDVDVCIVDEAHQLPDLAARSFAVSVSQRVLDGCVNDFGHFYPVIESPLEDLIAETKKAIFSVSETLDSRAEKSIGTDTLEVLEEGLALFKTLGRKLIDLNSDDAEGLALADRFERAIAALERFLDSNQPGVYWFEERGRYWTLHWTPSDVAEEFSLLKSSYADSWVFTSATLSVKDRFEYFMDRLGLENADSGSFPSPFDYQNNTLLFLPDLSVLPKEPLYTKELCRRMLPLIRACRGGVFFLFTSYRALYEAEEWLSTQLEDADGITLLAQNDAPRAELIERFIEDGNALLLGTMSFWEGVDVRGHALRCVIVDKLPFTAPSDPLQKARRQAAEERGQDAFRSVQIPDAILLLKQAVGRLIRGYEDQGVVVLADPRIKRSNYGKSFLKSLPPMPITSDEGKVMAFLESISEALQGEALQGEASHG